MASHLLAPQDNSYEIANEIGKGAYGTVYKARDLKNPGQFVALKEIRIMSRTEDGMPMSTLREIAMLRQLEKYEHDNIVRLLDVLPGRQSLHEMKLMLVFEHIEQDLSQYLEKCPSCGLGPDCIRDLMLQTMNGVDFLHTNRIVHRDLKPQNILVTSAGRVKIADFGLARIYSFSMALTTVVVTLYYRAPEVLLQDAYCMAVDIWSCGTIFAELHLRRPVFQGTSEIDQLRKIFHIMGLPSNSEWPPSVSIPRSSFPDREKQPLEKYIANIEPAARDLLNKMLTFNQKERISAVASLRHPYFTEEENDMSTSLSFSSLSNNTSCSSFGNDFSSPFRDLATKPETPISAGSLPRSSLLPRENTSGVSVQVARQREPDVIPSTSHQSRREGGGVGGMVCMEGQRTKNSGDLVIPDLLSCTASDGLVSDVIAQSNPLLCSENLPEDQFSPINLAMARPNGDARDRVHHSNSEKITERAQDLRISQVNVAEFVHVADNACKELPNGYHEGNDEASAAKRGIKRSRPY